MKKKTPKKKGPAEASSLRDRTFAAFDSAHEALRFWLARFKESEAIYESQSSFDTARMESLRDMLRAQKQIDRCMVVFQRLGRAIPKPKYDENTTAGFWATNLTAIEGTVEMLCEEWARKAEEKG